MTYFILFHGTLVFVHNIVGKNLNGRLRFSIRLPSLQLGLFIIF